MKKEQYINYMSELFVKSSSMTLTENGAVTYNTSFDKCLDFFAVVGALKNEEEGEEAGERAISLFKEAFNEDPVLALRILLYSRDIRNGGLGVRRVLKEVVKQLPELAAAKGLKLNKDALYDSIVEFGSWRDLFEDFQLAEIGKYVSEKMKAHIREGKYDLLEKWAPSIGGRKNKQAEYLAKLCELTPRQYRKYLSTARAQLKIVERDMCANRWDSINYSSVPSKAGLLYSDAFSKHDRERYRQFISDATEGKVHINTSAIYPYEIVKKYWYRYSEDPALEALWKNLPDYTNSSNENAIVVADTSGSMYGTPIYVATSLAIYFAERNKGKFHNEFISFSATPSFISLDDCKTLKEKIRKVEKTDWGYNTDLIKVFFEILSTGKRFNLPQSEMPRTIYIVSDMEFDEAVSAGNAEFNSTNYEAIKELYNRAGYDLPAIVFWNVRSHSSNIPVTKDDTGTALVSGCSPTVFQTAVARDINPMKMMYSMLDICKEWEDAANSILVKTF